MNDLAAVLLDHVDDRPVRLVYGAATARNTVRLRGATTALALPALTPVAAGDYCAVLEAGADRVILGPVDRPGGQGVVAFAERTSSQGSITSITDITGLSVTWTAVAGRRYRISMEASLQSSVGGDVGTIVIADGSNNQQVLRRFALPSSNVTQGVFASVVQSPAAGSVTRKVRALRSSGSGNVTFVAAGDSPAFLLVEDLGVAT